MKRSKQFLTGLFITLATSTMVAQNGVNFDGVDDKVSTPYSGVLASANRTFEAWVYVSASAPASNLTILDYGINLAGSRNTFVVAGDRSLKFISGGTNGNITSTAADVPVAQWAHVAFVLDNGTGYLYVDGVQVGTGTLSGVNTPSGNENMTIGERVLGGSIPFNGNIDEVRVWDVARSASEISDNMNNEFCGNVNGLVAYHQFNQGIAGGTNTTETTSIDGSGFGNDGTLNGFTLTGATSNWVAGQTLSPGSVLNQLTLSECVGFEITVGNNTYNSTGMYDDTLVGASVAGCDSIVVLDLTILSGTSSSQTISECGGYTVTVGNNTYSSTGIYIDTLAAINGCDSIVTTDLTVNVSNVTTSISLSTITVAETGTMYQWLDCNDSYAEITGETSQSFTATINGDYAVVVTIGNCTDTSACENISNVGIKENVIASVNLKPNPTFGIVQVEVLDFTGKITINVLDITGKQYVNAVYFNNVVELDLGYLNNGVYFVQIIDGRKSQIIKLIKL